MQNIPTCVGIIMDGNRRWAQANGLPKLEGHRRGLSKIEDVTRWAAEAGVRHLALYALSTENLQRAQDEVAYFMDLAIEAANTKLADLGKENVRVRFVGNLAVLPQTVQDAVRTVETNTAANTGITLWICLAYGGHAEIAAAAQAVAAAGEAITEASIAQHLWTADMPDPDIIIRPGGEKRLSGFLTWKSIYSELFFIDDMWPDVTNAKLDQVLVEFATRERRRGK